MKQSKNLPNAIEKPPYNLTPELVWLAYQQLEKSKVKGAGPQKLLTNIVSLVRFATGLSQCPWNHSQMKLTAILMLG